MSIGLIIVQQLYKYLQCRPHFTSVWRLWHRNTGPA